MKKTTQITLALLVAITALPAIAQPPHGGPDREKRRERIKAHKVAYLTEKLALTPEDAQVFWPVYNQFENKRQQARKAHRAKFKDHKQINEMSDKEVEAMLNAEMEFRAQEHELDKVMYLKMKETLSIKKVARLYRAEKQFKQQMLGELRKRREEREGPGSGGGPR